MAINSDPIQVVNHPKKRKNRFNFFLGLPYYLILIFLVVFPVVILFLSSITKSSTIGFSFEFTLLNYQAVLGNMNILSLLVKSLGVAVITTVTTLIIGYPLAYYLTKFKPSTQKFLILLVNAPMWINMLLKILAIKQIITIFDPQFLGSDLGMIIGLVYIYLPFMVLPIYTTLSKIDHSLYEGAYDLGASKTQTITKVVIPLSITGVLSGIIMVFLPAATTITVTKYLGTNTYFIGELIENAIKTRTGGTFGFGATISFLLAVVMVIMVYFFRKADRYGKLLNERD
jgi:spermidine/putrescine transport system permease protein